MIPLNENLSKLRRSEIRVFTNLARQTPDCVALTIAGGTTGQELAGLLRQEERTRSRSSLQPTTA